MEKKEKLKKKRSRVGNFFHRLFYGVDPTPLAGGGYADEAETRDILEGFPSHQDHDFLDIPDSPSAQGYDLDGGGSFGGAGAGGSWSDGDSGGYSSDSGSSDSGSSDCGSSDSGGGCDGGGGGSD